MNKNKKNRGFTLVELLVVIAIIGILAAIVMVSLGSTRDRARVASLQSTLASATTIANLCVNDGGSVQAPADSSTGGNTICDDTSVSTEAWPSLAAIQGLNSLGFYVSADDTSVIAAIDNDGSGLAATSSGDSLVTCTVNTGSCVRSNVP